MYEERHLGRLRSLPWHRKSTEYKRIRAAKQDLAQPPECKDEETVLEWGMTYKCHKDNGRESTELRAPYLESSGLSIVFSAQGLPHSSLLLEYLLYHCNKS